MVFFSWLYSFQSYRPPGDNSYDAFGLELKDDLRTPATACFPNQLIPIFEFLVPAHLEIREKALNLGEDVSFQSSPQRRRGRRENAEEGFVRLALRGLSAISASLRWKMKHLKRNAYKHTMKPSPNHHNSQLYTTHNGYFSASLSSSSISSKTLKTYLAGQSATEPHKATATAVASNIS